METTVINYRRCQTRLINLTPAALYDLFLNFAEAYQFDNRAVICSSSAAVVDMNTSICLKIRVEA